MRNQGGAVKKTTVTQLGISKKPRMKDSARSPKWFKRGGKGEVAPIPPPEGEDRSEHVRQVKHKRACALTCSRCGQSFWTITAPCMLFFFYQPLSTAAIRSGQNMHVPHEPRC